MRPSHRCDHHRFFWAVLLLIAVDATLQEGSKPDSTSTPNDNPLMRRKSKSAVGKLEQEGLETSRSNPAAKMASVELNARGGDYHGENKTSSPPHKDKDYVLMRRKPDGALTEASSKQSILLHGENGQPDWLDPGGGGGGQLSATCSSDGDCNGKRKWVSKCLSSCDEEAGFVQGTGVDVSGACLVACESGRCCTKTVTLDKCCEKERTRCRSSCDDPGWEDSPVDVDSGVCGSGNACAEGKTCCTKTVRRCKARCGRHWSHVSPSGDDNDDGDDDDDED